MGTNNLQQRMLSIAISRLTPAEREHFEERAAIIEYDGGLERAQAETNALQEVEAARPVNHEPTE